MNKIKSKKRHKANIHDLAAKELLTDKECIVEFFKARFTKRQFNQFNWTTLKLEKGSFVRSDLKERFMDVAWSVRPKRSKQWVRVIFLLEHKSSQEKVKHGEIPRLMLQLLEYQTEVYLRQSNPVIPIVVYHGKDKVWRGLSSFRGYLNKLPRVVEKEFGRYTLNFSYILVNIHELCSSTKAKKSFIYPMLVILSNIWSMSENMIKDALLLVSRLGEKDRLEMARRVVSYVSEYDERFTLERLGEIESKILKEGDRTMALVKFIKERDREEGREEGIKQGIEQGIEKGIEKGCENTALRMLKDGLEPDTVSKYTGLSHERIEELQKKAS